MHKQNELIPQKEFINMNITKSSINPLSDIIGDINDTTDNLDKNEIDCGALANPELTNCFKKKLSKNICYKCKLKKSNFFNRTEFICKDCLLKILNHKFRSNLRAHCKIRNEDLMLVCVSGGNNSLAMLHLFYATFNDNSSNRKLFFKLKVLHVDDNMFFALEEDFERVKKAREERRKAVEELCGKYGFECEIINLEEALKLKAFNEEIDHNEFKKNAENEQNENLIKEYISLFKSIPRIGSFNLDFNKIMTRNIIFDYAIKHNFNKIVFGDTAQGLVNHIFNQVVKGRGYSLREGISYIDSHFLNGKIQILKPLRDFLTKEVLIYNHIYMLNIQYCPLDLINLSKNLITSSHHLPYSGNTNTLVKFFFDNLQDKMSSTVNAVMGTAEKLKLKEKELQRTCQFCLSYIDEVYNELEIGSIDSIANDKIFSHRYLCFGCKRMFQAFQDKEELLAKIPIFYKN